jgi:hypothetical protein
VRKREDRDARFARFYIALVCAAGFLIGAVTLAQADWQSGHTFQFLVYLVFAALASRLKVTLPGVAGTLSVNFIFILPGAMDLGRAETLIISCVAICGESPHASASRTGLPACRLRTQPEWARNEPNLRGIPHASASRTGLLACPRLLPEAGACSGKNKANFRGFPGDIRSPMSVYGTNPILSHG